MKLIVNHTGDYWLGVAQKLRNYPKSKGVGIDFYYTPIAETIESAVSIIRHPELGIKFEFDPKEIFAFASAGITI